MSYCRFSDDSFKCDLYCFADSRGGWTTYVRSSRPKLSADWFDDDEFDWQELEKLYAEDYSPIGLSHDGEVFNDPTLEAFRERIVMLKAAGYNVPEWVLPRIDKEIAAKAR